MARGDAANTTTHADALWSSPRDGAAAPSARASLRRFVVIVAGVGFAAFGALIFSIADASREQALEEAAADLEILARAVTRDIADAIGGAAAKKDAPVVIPDYASRRGRRVAVADGAGRIEAAWPDLADGADLASLLGPNEILTTFADKAGVMRVTLADGTQALATVRNLSAGEGQVAVIQPLDAALADWRAVAWRYASLFAVAAAVTALALVGYRRQAGRTRAAERTNALIRRRIDTALSRGRCGLWDWDIARGRIYWSDSMYELLGLEAERRCISFGELRARMHPQDGDLATIAETIAASRTSSMDHEFRIKNARGEWIWLRTRAELVDDESGFGQHLVGIAVDISEQKALAEGAAAADMRLRDAIETISEAFVLWDAQNRLVACNSKFVNLHGLRPEMAVPGKSYAEIMASATAPLVQTEIFSSEAPSPTARTYEVRLADGRWLQINERRTKDGGYVSVGADITALKRNQEKLLESERRLTATVADLLKSRQALEAQAQQLATLAEQYHVQKGRAEAAYFAKSQFLANMSHELRTPLNAIIGFSEMMQAQVFGALGSQKYVEYCSHIHQGGSYLLAILTDILDMSRLEAGRVRLDERDVDISGAVRAAVERFRQSAESKRIEVVVDVSNGLRGFGDHDAIVKATGVLVSNSLKFTREGGRVHVRARRIARAIDIFVADDGCGIEASAIPKLGRPFEQPTAVMQNGMKGSGLGLAIARSLIALHGGSMRIRSRVGVGTIVMLRIPLKPKTRVVQTLAAPSEGAKLAVGF
jgi:two-component system cell cycle sensor histidine kinase PleC